MLQLGWAFFVLVVIASYTANLAASLSQNTAGSYIRNIDDAISKNMTSCVASAAEIDVRRQYPGALWATISYKDTRGDGAMAQAFVANNCSTIVWPMAYVDREVNDAKFMCDRPTNISPPWLYPGEVSYRGACAFPAPQVRHKPGRSGESERVRARLSELCAGIGSALRGNQGVHA